MDVTFFDHGEKACKGVPRFNMKIAVDKRQKPGNVRFDHTLFATMQDYTRFRRAVTDPGTFVIALATADLRRDHDALANMHKLKEGDGISRWAHAYCDQRMPSRDCGTAAIPRMLEEWQRCRRMLHMDVDARLGSE